MCQFCNDDPNKCSYASTCSVCGKKYFGNGYGCVELPCPACEKAKHAKTIKKSRWYLVRRELRPTRKWTFNVLLQPFQTAVQAEAYAKHFSLPYIPIRGEGVIERQVDESLDLVNIVYLSLPQKVTIHNGNKQ